MADYIYMVQMDIPKELEDDFNRIYDTQHIPNIVKAPGVHSCTRYKLESSDVDGTARYAAVYEIDSPQTPFTAEWVAASDTGGLGPDDSAPHLQSLPHCISQALKITGRGVKGIGGIQLVYVQPNSFCFLVAFPISSVCRPLS